MKYNPLETFCPPKPVPSQIILCSPFAKNPLCNEFIFFPCISKIDISTILSFSKNSSRLIDGLNFLNKQAPEILKKKDELSTKLVAFREKYKLIQRIVIFFHLIRVYKT